MKGSPLKNFSAFMISWHFPLSAAWVGVFLKGYCIHMQDGRRWGEHDCLFSVIRFKTISSMD